MADPTQANRSALASLIPKSTPLGKSVEAQRIKEADQLAADEANNLVMVRDPVALPPEALNVVDPVIPEPIVQTQASTPIQGPGPASVAAPQSSLIAPNSSKMDSIVNQQQEASDKLIAEADKFHARAEEESKQKIARTEEAVARTQKVVDEDYKAVKDFKFDNASQWSKASTGQKIGLMVGAFFSSLSPSSAQSFRDGVQKSIDTDIEQQKQALLLKKEKLGSSQSELAKLTMRLDGNMDAAAEILKGRIYSGIAMKAQIIGETAKSKLIVENSKAAQEAAYNASQISYQKAGIKAAKEADKASIPGWNGTVADATQRRNFTDKTVAGANMRAHLQELRKITAQTGKSFSPTSRAKSQNAIGALVSEYKTFKTLGTLDKGVQTLFEQLVQDPTGFFTLDASSLAKINAFDRSIDSELSRSAKSLGLTKQNSEIGRMK